MKDLKQIEQYTSYPKYKDSGIEWLGKIPEHWKVSRIEYVANKTLHSIDTKDMKGKELFYYDIPTVQSVNDGRLENGDNIESNKYKLKGGEVLISKLNPRKKTVVLTEKKKQDIVCSTEFVPFYPKKIMGKYLYYILSNSKLADYYNSFVKSATNSHQRVEPAIISKTKIPVPPLDEQRLIADFLDYKTSQIDSIIKDKEHLIELLQEQRQAIINEAVTKGLSPETTKMKDSGIDWIGEIPENWEVKRLKWVVSRVGSGKTPKGGAEVYKDSGVIFIRSQNVHFEGLRLDDVVYIDEKIDEEMKSSRVQPEDILLNITGASLGRCCLVPDKFPASNVNQHVCIIRPIKDKIYPQFLNLIISSNFVQKQIFESENGISREGLNFQQIKNLILIVPPINEQILISKTLENKTKQIDDLVTQLKKHIEKLSEYRQSLINEAVTGKIDVRGFRKGE